MWGEVAFFDETAGGPKKKRERERNFDLGRKDRRWKFRAEAGLRE